MFRLEGERLVIVGFRCAVGVTLCNVYLLIIVLPMRRCRESPVSVNSAYSIDVLVGCNILCDSKKNILHNLDRFH